MGLQFDGKETGMPLLNYTTNVTAQKPMTEGMGILVAKRAEGSAS